MAGLCMLLAVACAVSYLRDCSILRTLARNEVAGASHASEEVISLMNWVHANKSSKENPRYFLFPRLRATSLQVVQAGGDCADKSRLLSAMLRELEIPSTMVMCFHRETGEPTHTVVEAQIEADGYIVVDPVYGLVFPANERGRFYGLTDLRRDPRILDRRIDELLASAPRNSALRSYNTTSAAYDRATSINWNKNAVTRAAHNLMSAWWGDEVFRLPRPLILEEPKLFVASALLLLGMIALLATRIAGSFLAKRCSAPNVKGAALCGR